MEAYRKAYETHGWREFVREKPQAYRPVAVTTHNGWEKGYLDEAGDFRQVCDGSVIHGAHYWMSIPKRP